MQSIYGTDIITLPVSWLTWLATSDLRLAIYGLRPLYGIARFLHLLGVMGFVGSVMLVDLRLLGLWPEASLAPMRGPLIGVMHGAWLLAILTGILLFIYDPIGTGTHSMFLPKLLLIVFGLAYAHGIRGIGVIRRVLALRRGAAALSLAIWLAVVGASTWNHVERPVNRAAALHLHSEAPN